MLAQAHINPNKLIKIKRGWSLLRNSRIVLRKKTKIYRKLHRENLLFKTKTLPKSCNVTKLVVIKDQLLRSSSEKLLFVKHTEMSRNLILNPILILKF